MAKDKLQKRKEALERQRNYLLVVAIPQWCAAADWDEADRKVVNDRLIASAHAARCDRNGNYLDWRYYKPSSNFNLLANRMPHELALYCDVVSLDDMKRDIDWNAGKSLYRIAYEG